MKISLGTEEDIKITKKMGKEFFGTDLDPEQLNPDSADVKHLLKHRSSLVVAKEKGVIAGFVFSWPTTKKLMGEFVNKEINEQKLFDLSKDLKSFDAIYLCATIVRPEFRGKGLSTKLAMRSISGLSRKKKMDLFCWPTTKEGEFAINSLSKKLGVKIARRDN